MARRSVQAVRPADAAPGYPAWAWLSLGVVMGLVLAGVAWFKDWLPARTLHALPQPNPAAEVAHADEPAAAEAEPAKPAETKPKFDFYNVLPEMEVVIPDAQVRAAAKAPAPVAPAEPGARFWLQAASFRDTRQAEELKAKLALLGLRAQVAEVTINGSAWYRVRVGPYANAGELDAGKRTLEGNGMSAIALKEQAPAAATPQ
jgi:cell division protein FtsN